MNNKGSFSDSASLRAVTQVNAEQAPKTGIAEADPPPLKGKANAAANRGMTHDPRRRFCRGNGDGTRQEETNATRETLPVTDAGQRAAREGEARPVGVSERPIVPSKPGNSGGGKGPWFKIECRTWRQPGDWQ